MNVVLKDTGAPASSDSVRARAEKVKVKSVELVEE
jgi:hypothetical protein